MDPLEYRLAQWHAAKYGSRPVNIPATFRKLCEEVGELGESLIDGAPVSAKEEAADCAIILTHIVRELEGSLQEEMARKCQEIEARLIRDSASEAGESKPEE